MSARFLSSLFRIAFVVAAIDLAACATTQTDMIEPARDAAAARALAELGTQDVAWTTPGGDEAGSMPIGNGTFGANAWFDARGDLLLLLSHTDAFSEIERLLKLGRVRSRRSRSACVSPTA